MKSTATYAAAIVAFLNNPTFALRVQNKLQEPIYVPDASAGDGLEYADEDGSEALYYDPNEKVFYEITSEAIDDSGEPIDGQPTDDYLVDSATTEE